MSLVKIFRNGLVRENPLLSLTIGLCSALAVTNAVVNGIGMGLSMTFVLLMSELVISLFRKLIPDSIRIPIFIIVIAAFTTVIDYVLKAYFPELSEAMGVFIPLIVVNCIIMGRVESFASKQALIKVIPDALGMGLGYTWVLAGIALVREALGSGALLGFPIMPEGFQPILFFTLPPGGFFVFALFISLNSAIKSRCRGNEPAQRAAAAGVHHHGGAV
ncbi:MAG: electron transport complex subunit RsxE [Treponema sp.]|jgi:electron transport complex protein RnfE|nr:electron transport complex subunit RsxE [Treponema sp.]